MASARACEAKVQLFEGGPAFHIKPPSSLIYKWLNRKRRLKGFTVLWV